MSECCSAGFYGCYSQHRRLKNQQLSIGIIQCVLLLNGCTNKEFGILKGIETLFISHYILGEENTFVSRVLCVICEFCMSCVNDRGIDLIDRSWMGCVRTIHLGSIPIPSSSRYVPQNKHSPGCNQGSGTERAPRAVGERMRTDECKQHYCNIL